MKRICVINPNYYQSSGVTKVIHTIYNKMNTFYPNKLDFYFIDCQYGTEKSNISWISKEKYKIIKLMTNNPIQIIVEAFRLVRFIKDNNIDIIHVHHRRLLVIINFILSFYPIEILYTSHLNYSYNFFFKYLIHNRTLAISESVARNIINTTHSKNIDLVGNPVDFPNHPPEVELSLVKDFAISIGRLVPIKGHKEIIEAYKILKQKGFNKKLLIVGEGSEENNLRQLINEYDLANNVILVGYNDNVSSYIEKSLFAILHSSIEGLPMVIIEAAAQGRATLVSDIDGCRETVPKDASLKNLVSFGDVNSLASAIEEWFKDPEKTAIEGKKFYFFLKDKFSSESVIKRYYEQYTRI